MAIECPTCGLPRFYGPTGLAAPQCMCLGGYQKAAAPAPAPAAAPQDERANNLLIGQAQQLIGALMNHGLVARSLPEDQYLKLWDVVKRQLRCVNQEGARAALAATPAPAPLTNAQFERLYNNLPPSIQQDARSRLAFIRIGRAVEAAHGIGASTGGGNG